MSLTFSDSRVFFILVAIVLNNPETEGLENVKVHAKDIHKDPVGRNSFLMGVDQSTQPLLSIYNPPCSSV